MKIGYARISTGEQNADLQLSALTAAGCEKIFIETASGTLANREQLRNALGFLRAGDSLVVWKLDRLARSLRQLIQTVEEFKVRGVELISLTEAIDTASPSGLLLFHVMGALAEFERSLLVERTKAGISAARAKGKNCGRPRSLSVDDVHAARVLLSDPSISVAEAAKRLGVSVPTLYRYFPAAKATATKRGWSVETQAQKCRNSSSNC